MQSRYCSGISHTPGVIPVTTKQLIVPDLNFLANVLDRGLRECFLDVQVDVVHCPDLIKEPFNLASAGMCGRTALIDIGHTLYTRPFPRQYNIKEILIYLGRHNHKSFIFGDSYYLKERKDELNELIFNATYEPMYNSSNTPELITTCNRNRIIKRNMISMKCKVYENHEVLNLDHQCRIQGTFFLSDGETAPVLRVLVKNRKPQLIANYLYRPNMPIEFERAMEKALYAEFGKHNNNLVVLGGVYTTRNVDWKHRFSRNRNFFYNVRSLTSKLLAIPERNCTVITPETKIGTFSSTRIGVFPSLEQTNIIPNNMRFHCLSHSSTAENHCTQYNESGIEYYGHFCPAEKLYRIDQPLIR